MQEKEEELIDLDDNGKEKEKENFIENSNSKNHNYLGIFLFLISIVVCIIIFFSISNKMNSTKENKSLVIFDFDKTITQNDTFEEQIQLLNSKEAEDDLLRRVYDENWASVMAETYERFYDMKITIQDINKYIDKVEINKGMRELFNFLKDKKDKFLLVIFSAGHLYQVNRVLEKNNLTNFFDDIVAFNSYVKDGKIIIDKPKEFNCDRCKGIGQCKTQEFNILKNKYEEKNIFFDKIYYICDGINDYCLARNLEKKDELLIRKDYSLDKYLYNSGYIKGIECDVIKWDNGFDIINFFKSKNIY